MAGHVLVAGASGVIGREAVQRFTARGWQVTALSRRDPDIAGARHLAVDLIDAAATAEAVTALGPVSHLVYAAVHEEADLVSGWRSERQMEINLSMFRNLAEPLAHAGDLRHASLFQGTKAYGVHIRPFPVPARESWPRHAHDNFYWLQEDLLRDISARRDIGFTIWRPQIVFGEAQGVAMNVTPVLGAYAALEAAAGRPVGYPGGPGYVLEATDARLIADALVWAAEANTARGEIFNITNGDVFTWPNVWPAICAALGVEPGPAAPAPLARDLPGRSDEWAALAKRAGLVCSDLDALIGRSHQYADFIMATGTERPPEPVVVSTVKLRQAGFGACIDTETMFRDHIAALQRSRVLPPPTTT